MSCPHRFDVGVYVLGALDAGERAPFEDHLGGCDECTAELRRLGGLPGLLARAGRSGPVEGAGPDEPPPGILDGVAGRMRRRRRSRRLLVAAGAVVVLGVGVLAGWSLAPRETVAVPVRTVELQSAAADAPVYGEAGLAGEPWGTAITLRCRTMAGRPAPARDAPRSVYVLTVRGPDGSVQQVARWSPPPGQDVDVQAATNLDPAAVAGLEVRTGTGQLVLAG
ncbi:anti-sigma factor family protein [Pseudonocardia endophytica]|uniref:Putative zinc finger protein n=1 Tax=Pseudonocardia endophytica TaxID=401976 RepID=A0A4V2PIL5_PSEEN|nr:zf-HC2 domain-containing protein [Pseudonocardia endophytica]TCK25156.1 putative zinc finger protein [Pseudonocardia endophytica]